jgi:hypothetical protein
MTMKPFFKTEIPDLETEIKPRCLPSLSETRLRPRPSVPKTSLRQGVKALFLFCELPVLCSINDEAVFYPIVTKDIKFNTVQTQLTSFVGSFVIFGPANCVCRCR